MRDPERIKPFLNELKRVWSTYPDWRFGQLISNMMHDQKVHLFFIEDEDFLKLIRREMK